jgi:hypothetical protein
VSIQTLASEFSSISRGKLALPKLCNNEHSFLLEYVQKYWNRKQGNKQKQSPVDLSKWQNVTFHVWLFYHQKILINLGNVKRNAVRAGKNKAASPRPMWHPINARQVTRRKILRTMMTPVTWFFFFFLPFLWPGVLRQSRPCGPALAFTQWSHPHPSSACYQVCALAF